MREKERGTERQKETDRERENLLIREVLQAILFSHVKRHRLQPAPVPEGQHLYECIYVFVHVYVYVCVCVYICAACAACDARPAPVCMHVCMYVCMHACMYTCSLRLSRKKGSPCQRATPTATSANPTPPTVTTIGRGLPGSEGPGRGAGALGEGGGVKPTSWSITAYTEKCSSLVRTRRACGSTRLACAVCRCQARAESLKVKMKSRLEPDGGEW